MFRYYGIPARYVEGYLITPQDIEGKQAGDTIEIPGTNGHAWTEIYVDGLGWIPLEMTPSYYGVMEEANLKTGLEAKGKLAASIPETESQPPVEENIRTNFSLNTVCHARITLRHNQPSPGLPVWYPGRQSTSFSFGL